METKNTVKNIKAYPTALFDEEGYLKLDSNESDFGPSPKVLEALKNVKQSDIQYYPYYGKLLQKLADFHNVGIENIILTCGGDEAIRAIIDTFLEVGSNVLTVAPSFVMPKIYSKITGMNYLEIPYKQKWVFPKDEFINNIDKADFIHLTTPNSPTGEVIASDVINKIVDVAENRAVLIDETYANFSGVTNIDLINKHNNVFIVRSFSKDFALAGLRLGYIIAAPDHIKDLRKYLSPYNVSNLTVKAGIAALEDLKYFDKIKDELEKSKTLLSEGLKKLGATVYPSKTNFLCVDFGPKAEFVYNKLLQNKIKVKYFGSTPLLENSFRIGIPRLENTIRLLEALRIKPTIVFDMDGVIVDASKSYRVAVQKTFNYFTGKEVSTADISAAKKLGGLNNDWDLTQHLLRNNGTEVEYQNIIDVFQGFYEKLADTEDLLIHKNFLETLSEEFNLAIFTGRLNAEAYFTLDKHDITKYFHPIITLESVGMDHQKPDTLGLEMIKEQIITNKIYYLGDTVDDMICAANASVTGIGVLPPQDKSEELKQLLKSKKAMVVLNQTTDLINCFSNENNIKNAVQLGQINLAEGEAI